jgi:hypothetical protein
MTTDQIIALASSIGACLSAFATFLTVKQVSKQREFSYRPEIAISKVIFNCGKNSITEGKIPDTWLKESDSKEVYNYFNDFSIPLKNVGLGAAKNIEIFWSFAIEELVAIINTQTQKLLIPAYFEYNGKSLLLKSEGMGESVSMWNNQKIANIDFILPASVEKAATELILPHAYIQLVSALIYFKSKSENLDFLKNVPCLQLRIKYSDIGRRQHEVKYNIFTSIVAVMNKGEEFSGYIEGKKAA